MHNGRNEHARLEIALSFRFELLKIALTFVGNLSQGIGGLRVAGQRCEVAAERNPTSHLFDQFQSIHQNTEWAECLESQVGPKTSLPLWPRRFDVINVRYGSKADISLGRSTAARSQQLPMR